MVGETPTTNPPARAQRLPWPSGAEGRQENTDGLATCERLMLLPECEYFAAWIISVLDPRRAESALHMLDRVANRFADNMVAERTERLREALADSLSSLDGACRALRVGYEAGIAQELRRLVEVADSLGVQVPEDGRFWLDMRAALEESDERAD